MNNVKNIIFLLAFLIISPSSPVWGNPAQYVTEDTTLLLYVKDFPHLEDNLRETGLLDLESESIAYLVDYFADDYPFLKFYKTFRNLQGDHFLKALIEDVILLRAGGNSPVIILKTSREYAFFHRLVQTLQLEPYFRDFTLQNYVIDFAEGTILLSRSKSALETYKIAPKNSINDTILTKQLEQGGDIIFYKRGGRIFHPFLDSLFVEKGLELRVAAGVELAAKGLSIYSSLSSTSLNPPFRAMDFGWHVPEKSLMFLDCAVNPGWFFEKILGQEAMSDYLSKFEKVFEPQFSFALLDISEDLKPSFVLVMKANDGRNPQAKPVLAEFLTEVLGEQEWEAVEIGEIPVMSGKLSGFLYYSLGGFTILTDSEERIRESFRTLTGRLPSIWDKQELDESGSFTEKPVSFMVDLTKLSQFLAKTIFNNINLRHFKEEDIEPYIEAINKLGVLVGYKEYHQGYAQYDVKFISE